MSGHRLWREVREAWLTAMTPEERDAADAAQERAREELAADERRHGYLRPLKVWSTPSRRAAAGRYWWWKCRVCDESTKDLLPALGFAHDDALRHLAIMHTEAADD